MTGAPYPSYEDMNIDFINKSVTAKMINYENWKEHLKSLNLSPEDYQSRIKKIADALDI